ncbi:hypothetical protein [Pseudohoeflea coraliihabitans]|uniref:Uncharacterized protein n=1 Tax=Pseudohoeflea coraliihabitans TaxID=2860393 RepID=A0ABS6WTC2_9HYPH|nr:hypothetical protein [Pseudohoeflea sp. DP4N28-3]MBW3099206.1 hypothetical protein [Pseudohoeflea sp. DP4N28-3]
MANTAPHDTHPADPATRGRDTVVVSDTGRGNAGAWVFGIVLALLAAFAIWYFAASTDTTTPSTVNIEGSAATSSAETPAPAADDAAPAAPAADVAPAGDAAPAADTAQ